MNFSIIFSDIEIHNFSLKNGRYGTYLLINGLNVAIPAEFKTKLNKDNFTKELALLFVALFSKCEYVLNCLILRPFEYLC